MKCKYKESCGYEFCLDDCCPEFEAAVETNADRIRDSDDEKMAHALAKLACPVCKLCVKSFNCIECWLEVLQQPAEVSVDGN